MLRLRRSRDSEFLPSEQKVPKKSEDSEFDRVTDVRLAENPADGHVFPTSLTFPSITVRRAKVSERRAGNQMRPLLVKSLKKKKSKDAGVTPVWFWFGSPYCVPNLDQSFYFSPQIQTVLERNNSWSE